MKFQSMDSAPRDGTEVLLKVEILAGIRGKFLVGHYMPGGHCIEDHPAIDSGWYFWNGCMFDKASKPLEWAPLPLDDDEPEPQKPDWRVGLSCTPKYRHDDLWYERGRIIDVLPDGTNGLADKDGILKIKMDSGSVILRRADEWVTA